MKPSELKNLLKVALKNNAPVLITGAPGVGKTDIVTQVTKELNYHLILSHPVVSDPTDYKGMPWVTVQDGKPKAWFVPFSDLEELIEAKKETVFFLDDLGQANTAVQAACMQLLLARRINGHKVSDKVTFIAATNRREDLAGVTGLLEPVKSRFWAIIELKTDLEDWIKWAIENDMPIELIAFIRFRPEMLGGFRPSRDLVNSPSPRTIANVGKWIKGGIPESIKFETFAGAAGEGFASEFVSFIELFKKIPDVDEVINNPTKGNIPSEVSILYALCSAIAQRANEKNIANIITYIDRIPQKEFAIMTLRDSLTRNNNLAKTKAFIDWASKNAKFFIQ